MIVSSVIDPDHTDVPLTWRPQERITRFTAPEGVRELANDNEGGQLGAGGPFGAGHYVYLAVNLDSYTNEGTSHYPYFPEYLSTTFGATTSLRNRHIEVYFDPDYRPGRTSTGWRPFGIARASVRFILKPQYSRASIPSPTTSSFVPATAMGSLFTPTSYSPW